MNSYTFVPKLQNLSSQHGSQPSSILQRLQQLKQSMRPAESLQQQYQSVPPNSNPGGQYSSAVQNQRLFQYLPKETEQRIPSDKNEEGMGEYESYRKSLQKKLNYLFQKEKQIMKTQSTYPPLRGHQQAHHGHSLKGQTRYTDELQNKYNQLLKKDQNAGNINQPYEESQSQKVHETQVNDQRQYKVHSTIQTSYVYRPYAVGNGDEEIDQMQRKIKMLEMKYLGGYSQQGLSPNQYDVENDRGKKIALSGISQVLPKNNTRSNKTKQRKEKTSPDKINKHKHNTSQKQTIQNISIRNKEDKTSKQVKNDKKSIPSPLKNKHPIKDYMNTIEHLKSEQNEQNRNQAGALLHKEFNQLKRQFHSLLEINKSMIEKVQMNEEQRLHKREKKQRAKAMLKQIMLRLDEIKWELQGQANSSSKTIKNKFTGQRIKSRSQCEVRFQKSSNKVLEKKPIERPDNDGVKSILFSNKKSMAQNENELAKNEGQMKASDVNQVERLKKLLNLEVQHRHIVQKKLEVIYGAQILA